MCQIQIGSVITLNLTGKLEDGKKIISSDNDPLTFKVGEFKIIKGLNTAVIGMKVNDKKTITLPPDDAFGHYNEELVFSLPQENLPENLEVGMSVTDEKNEYIFRVIEIDKSKNSVSLDGNHFLAGLSIIFDIEILEIK